MKQGSGLELTGDADLESNAAKSRTNAGAKSHAGKGKDLKQPVEINDKTLKLFRHFIDTSNLDKKGDKDPQSAYMKKKDQTDALENNIPA